MSDAPCMNTSIVSRRFVSASVRMTTLLVRMAESASFAAESAE